MTNTNNTDTDFALNIRAIVRAYTACRYMGPCHLGWRKADRIVRTRRAGRLAIIVTDRGVYAAPAKLGGNYSEAVYCGPNMAFARD